MKLRVVGVVFALLVALVALYTRFMRAEDAPSPIEVPDNWDFYFTDIDGAPASVLLNFAFEDIAPVPDAPQLYWASLKFADSSLHGMGDDDTNETLGLLEDKIAHNLKRQSLYYVARRRNAGDWRMFFYGPERHLTVVETTAKDHGATHDPTVGQQHDPKWSYYFDVVLPDANQRRWMGDRSVVDSLVSHGDTLMKRRRVDHWAYFDSAGDREKYIQAAQSNGFTLEEKSESSETSRPFGVQVYRTDSVRLEDINKVTTLLDKAAVENNGEYDGWETSVEREQADEQPGGR